MKRPESRDDHLIQRILLPFYIVSLTAKVSPVWLVVTIVSALLVAAWPLCNVWFSRILLDGLLSGWPWPQMMITGATVAGINFLFQTGKRSLASVQAVFSQRFRDDFKCLAGGRIMSIDYAMLESPRIMDLKERALRPIIDYGMLEQVLKDVIPGILGGLFLLFATVMIALRSFPVLVIVLLIITAINIWLMEWVRKVKNRTYQVVIPVERKTGSYNSVISDYSLGKDIRIYGMDKLLMGKLCRLNREDLKTVTEQFNRISVGTGASALLCHLQMLIVYSVLAMWTMKKGMDIADYIFFSGIFLNLGTALSRTTDKMSELLYVGKFFSSFREFEEIPLQETSVESKRPVSGKAFCRGQKMPMGNKSFGHAPEICIKNVSFSYPGTDTPVLKELSLTLRRGERVAVVGENGAGKTTLVKLLCGLYQPDKGEILLDGRHIWQEKEGAVVFQDFRLYAFTIYDNVALGKQEGTSIKSCLDQAGLGKVVDALPEKENSYLYKIFEKNGVELSGGNGQRLAIARALYRDRGFLLMDEPTSALDPAAEEELFRCFKKISDGKTTIMISHRLSAALFCDRILVLHNGRIAEDGSHEELMRINGGIYRKMYETQAKYYKR